MDIKNEYKIYALRYAKHALILNFSIYYSINNIYKRQYLHYCYLNKINEQFMIIDNDNYYQIATYYSKMTNWRYLYDITQKTSYTNKILYYLILSNETNNNKMAIDMLFMQYIDIHNLKLAYIYYKKLDNTYIDTNIKHKMDLYIKENALLCIKRFLIHILYIPSYGILYKRGLVSFNQLQHYYYC